MRKVLLLIGLLFALTACSTEIIMEQPTVQLRHAITAQGMAEFEVAPDLAKVRFRIETRAPTAQEAQLRNRELSSTVEAALLQAGVRKNELETTNYRVNRIQEWDPTERKNIFKGYSVTNVFVVSTKAIDTVGPLFDVGIQAGANNVDSISFELSDAKRKEVKTEALRDATINAREKAEALALGAGVSVGKLLTLAESSFSIMPYARGGFAMESVAMADAPPTSISPESVRVSAQVSVSYEIA